MKRVIGAFLLTALLQAGAVQAENLYRASDFRPLTADRRAQKVGDVLTVLITEDASATATSGSKTDKKHDTGIKVNAPNTQRNYTLGLNDNFDGNGQIARSGRLLAQLSVVVIGVEAGGALRIKGNQIIEINGEKQTINLEGLVRPTDIGEGNTVPSNRIAEARIHYVGDGVLAENQTKGLFSRVLSSILHLF